jgi:hypothetical protein
MEGYALAAQARLPHYGADERKDALGGSPCPAGARARREGGCPRTVYRARADSKSPRKKARGICGPGAVPSAPILAEVPG